MSDEGSDLELPGLEPLPDVFVVSDASLTESELGLPGVGSPADGDPVSELDDAGFTGASSSSALTIRTAAQASDVFQTARSNRSACPHVR